MTASTPTCSSCGATTRTLNDDDHCVDCEVRQLEVDSYAATAIRDTLGAAARAALDYLDGEDVRQIVSEAVGEGERSRAGAARHTPLIEIDRRLHRRMGERLAARERRPA